MLKGLRLDNSRHAALNRPEHNFNTGLQYAENLRARVPSTRLNAAAFPEPGDFASRALQTIE